MLVTVCVSTPIYLYLLVYRHLSPYRDRGISRGRKVRRSRQLSSLPFLTFRSPSCVPFLPPEVVLSPSPEIVFSEYF